MSKLYANGVGYSSEIWFNSSKEYVLKLKNTTHKYIDTEDVVILTPKNTSNPQRFEIEIKDIDCIKISSEEVIFYSSFNKKEVDFFTKAAKCSIKRMIDKGHSKLDALDFYVFMDYLKIYYDKNNSGTFWNLFGLNHEK